MSDTDDLPCHGVKLSNIISLCLPIPFFPSNFLVCPCLMVCQKIDRNGMYVCFCKIIIIFIVVLHLVEISLLPSFEAIIILQFQEAALGAVGVIKEFLDDNILRKVVLPKAKSLFFRSTSVKVNKAKHYYHLFSCMFAVASQSQMLVLNVHFVCIMYHHSGLSSFSSLVVIYQFHYFCGCIVTGTANIPVHHHQS